VVALSGAAVACGGDDEGAPPTSEASATTRAATEILPDLTGDGFDMTVPEKLPNTGALDIAFSIYDKSGMPPVQARAEVRVYPTGDDAAGDFENQAEGWKTPPPGLFGGDPANEDAEPLDNLDDAVAYIATNRDPSGFRLWTDIYRVGNVIVVAHVLGQNEADVTPVRQLLAERVRAGLR
jgi:hypothetical protein